MRRTIHSAFSCFLLLAACLFAGGALSLSCSPAIAQPVKPPVPVVKPVVARAASIPDTQPATQPATQPTTLPTTRPTTRPSFALPTTRPFPMAPRPANVWFATTQPSPNATGYTPDSPLDLSRIYKRGSPGDVILLRYPENFGHLWIAGRSAGFTFNSYNGGMAIVDAADDEANAPISLAGVTGRWEFAGLRITDSRRDVTKPGFVQGTRQVVGLSETGSDSAQLWIHDCQLDSLTFGVDLATMTHQQGTVIERNTFRNLYSAPNLRCEAVYIEGQQGFVLQDNKFENCGFRDPAFTQATTQDWGLYSHGGDGLANGPVLVQRNSFINCAAGPTSNCGGIFDANDIIDCNHQVAGVPGFLSSDWGVFSNNRVVNSFYNLISRDLSIRHNTFVNPGPFAENIDVPAHAVGWRTSRNLIESIGNTVYGNCPLVIRQVNMSGAPLTVDMGDLDVVKPYDPALEQRIRQEARTRGRTE